MTIRPFLMDLLVESWTHAITGPPTPSFVVLWNEWHSITCCRTLEKRNERIGIWCLSYQRPNQSKILWICNQFAVKIWRLRCQDVPSGWLIGLFWCLKQAQKFYKSMQSCVPGINQCLLNLHWPRLSFSICLQHSTSTPSNNCRTFAHQRTPYQGRLLNGR